MTNIVPFSFESNEIRVVTDESGEPLFVAKDVLQALEYSIDGGLSKYVKHVPDEWKGGKPISTPSGIQNATQAIDRLDEDERSMLSIGRQGEAILSQYLGADAA